MFSFQNVEKTKGSRVLLDGQKCPQFLSKATLAFYLFILFFFFDVVYRPLSQRKKSITKDYSYLPFTLQLLALIPQTVAVFAIGLSSDISG